MKIISTQLWLRNCVITIIKIQLSLFGQLNIVDNKIKILLPVSPYFLDVLFRKFKGIIF